MPSAPTTRPERSLRRWGLNWLAGLPLLIVLWAAASYVVTVTFDDRLQGEVDAVVRASAFDSPSGEPWLRVSIDGRDLVAAGEAASPSQHAAALDALAGASGVRHVDDRIGIVVDAAPFVWHARLAGEGRLVLNGHRPVETGATRLRTALTTTLGEASVIVDETHAARGGPPGFLDAARYAVERLRRLQPGGRATLRDRQLSFEGEARDTDAYATLQTERTGDSASAPAGFTLAAGSVVPPGVQGWHFAIERSDGDAIRLRGHTGSASAHGALRAALAEHALAGAIDDGLHVARGLPDDIDETALTGFAVRLIALVAEGRVAFEGRRIEVSGRAIDAQAVTEVQDAVSSARPAGVEPGSVSLEAGPVLPYRVRIQREAGTLVLTGHVPDRDALERLIRQVRGAYFHEQVSNRLRVAEGAPAGFEQALADAVSGLSTLAKGEIEIVGTHLRLSGESLYAQSTQRLNKPRGRPAPAGWTITTTVTSGATIERYDAAACSSRFEERVAKHALRFVVDAVALDARTYPVLDALAALAQHCPDRTVEVYGYDQPAGTTPSRPDLPEYTASLGTPGKSERKAGPPKASRKGTAAKGKSSPPPATEKAKDAAPPAPEPTPDLARLRADAVGAYLVEAGIASGRVRVFPRGGATDRVTLAFPASTEARP